MDFSKVQTLKIRENTNWNYSYYPVIFKNEAKMLEVQKVLNDNKIMPRRYFFPSLNTINFINSQSMPVSESIASRVLCLPLYKSLDEQVVLKIIRLINN